MSAVRVSLSLKVMTHGSVKVKMRMRRRSMTQTSKQELVISSWLLEAWGSGVGLAAERCVRASRSLLFCSRKVVEREGFSAVGGLPGRAVTAVPSTVVLPGEGSLCWGTRVTLALGFSLPSSQ